MLEIDHTFKYINVTSSAAKDLFSRAICSFYFWHSFVGDYFHLYFGMASPCFFVWGHFLPFYFSLFLSLCLCLCLCLALFFRIRGGEVFLSFERSHQVRQVMLSLLFLRREGKVLLSFERSDRGKQCKGT